MEVKILKECGFEEALLGLSLSFQGEPKKRVADRLAFRQGGHNKFLESMMVWLDIDAPRYWWSQFDTYRVGTTKQSESTMHTIMSGYLSSEDFEGQIDKSFLKLINWKIVHTKDFEWVKKHLPESFLQRRIVCTNYKTLQNMEFQRRSHRLSEWQLFLDEVIKQAEYPEYLKEIV